MKYSSKSCNISLTSLTREANSTQFFVIGFWFLFEEFIFSDMAIWLEIPLGPAAASYKKKIIFCKNINKIYFIKIIVYYILTLILENIFNKSLDLPIIALTDCII